MLLGDASSANVRSFRTGLQAEQIDVISASFEPGPDTAHLHSPLRGSSLRYLLAGPQVRRLVDRNRPDVVIGYFASGYGTMARRSGGSRVAVVVAGSDVLGVGNRAVLARVVGKNLRECDLVIAWSQHLADAAQALGARSDRILVQARGVDLSVFLPPLRSVSEPRIITSRSLQSKYRHDMLIRALAELERPWTASIVGDGPDRARLLQLTDEAGIADRVSMPGRLEPARLADVLREHSIYVSTCPTDGVSASLLEAMACGLFPVVTDNASNRPWVTHGANGLLHDGSIADLKACLARAIDDEPLRDTARKANSELITRRGDRTKNMAVVASALRHLAET